MLQTRQSRDNRRHLRWKGHRHGQRQWQQMSWEHSVKGKPQLYVAKITLSKEKLRTKLYPTAGAGRPNIKNDLHSKDNIWQRRVWHANKAIIEHMFRHPSFVMNPDIHPGKCNCEVCGQTKATKQSANAKLVESSKEMTIHAGVCGLLNQETFDRKHSSVVYTSHYTSI